ncbi:MAG TPA: hypothetical protein PKJ65_07260, partial [Clostridia bacterium]|nr:hypothetical protein [Clostridia bacterium]
GTNFRLRVNIPTTVKDGEQFVFSFAFSRTYSSQTIYVSTPSKIYTFQSEVVSSGIYKRYSFVFTKSAEDSYVEIYTSAATANWTLNSKEYQIELGNKATDWTPAPEDVQEDYATKLGYSSYSDLVTKATAGSTIIKGGYLNTDLIEARSIVAGKIATGTITAKEIDVSSLTVKFLKTVGDANGYKVQIENSKNSDDSGAESYVRLVNSDGTRKAELVFDDNNVYGGSGGLPVLRITDDGCYSRVFAEGLEAVSTTDGRFEYNMISQFTPFGMVFATGTHSSAAVKGGFTWNKDDEKVLIYVNTLPRGGSGTVSEGFLYRSPDGLNNDVIRYKS